jgi:hypothetical protein
MEATCRLTFNGLSGVIAQKIELFITIAMRSSNPTEEKKAIFYRQSISGL